MKKYIKYIIILLLALLLSTIILMYSLKITNVQRTATGELITAEIAGININWYYEY